MIDPMMFATLTGILGAMLAALWSYLMASKVAAPRAKRLIVEALTTDGPEVQAVRAALIQPALDAQYAAFTGQTAAGGTQIASEVENAVNSALEAFNANLGPMMSNHINMALKQAEAQQSKRVGGFLKELGLEDQMAALEDGVREQAMEALPAQAQVLMEIMQTKIPKSATTSERILMQAAKVTAAQLLQGGMAAQLGQPAGAVSELGKGFGVR